MRTIEQKTIFTCECGEKVELPGSITELPESWKVYVSKKPVEGDNNNFIETEHHFHTKECWDTFWNTEKDEIEKELNPFKKAKKKDENL